MAIAPVVIEFLAKGMPQVQQAFKSIHDAAIRAERAQQVEADKTEKAVRKSAEARAKAQIAAMKKADTWQRQAWAAGDKEAARVEKARIASEERIAKAKIAAMVAGMKAADKARADELKRTEAFEKKQRAIRDKSATMAGQFAVKQAKAEADAAKQAAAAAKRAQEDQYNNIKARISRTKQAEKDLDAWQRSVQKQQAKDEEANRPEKIPGRNNAAFGRVIESVAGATVRGVGAGLSRAGNISMGLANTAAQLGGGFSIADSVMGEQNLRKQAATLSASTLLAGANADRKIGTEEILSRAKAIGIEQNIDPAEVLAAFDSTKKLTGDLDMAMNLSPAVAKISKATGSDMSDVSTLAGNLLANRGHYDKKDAGKVQADIESQLAVLTKQGIVGGVELEDMAKYGARLTAGSVYFGGDKSKNEATLGAMAQMSKQYGGAAKASEAALASQRFSTDVANHADSLKANLGIDVRDGKGNIRDAQGLILDMLQKTGGDVTKLKSTGLGERGVRPLVGAANLYKAAGGGQAGLDAVKKEFAKYTTGVSKEELDAANKRVLAEQKIEKSMLELRIAAGEQLLPVFKDMIPVLKEIIPQLVTLAKNSIPAFQSLMETAAKFAPVLAKVVDGIGPIPSLIAFELTKSFAAAGLPALLRGLFAGAFGQGRVPNIPAPNGSNVPTPGGGGGRNYGALGVGGVTTAALIAYNGYENYQGGGKKADAMAAAVASGAISPEAAAAEVAAAKGRISSQNSFGSQILEMGSNALLGPTAGFYNAYRHSEGAGDYSLADSKKLQNAIAEAAAAGVREGVKNGLQNNSGSTGSGRAEPIINR